MSDAKAKITLGGDTAIELDVLKGTLGQDVIDIRSLGSKGVFTFDPGFTSTASCESKITFIDGDEGILLHRGFPIDQLATESNYLEVCYILLYGEKPTQAEYDEFKTTVTRHTMIHEQITRLFHAFRRDSHPMAVMCGITGALAAFYHDSLDVNNPRHREIAAYRLLSKMPTMAAMCYKYSIGQPFVYPRNDLSYAGNFLRMMFATPCEEYEVNPVLERAMDRILILHADHEQNASTSTVRTAGSSGANPFACIAAGIASLWGPAHGGANEAALKMLEEISSVEHIPEFVRRAKDKNDSFRLMGFGHRVYKNYDPRVYDTAKSTGGLMLIIGGATIFSYACTRYGISVGVQSLLENCGKGGFLIITNIVLLIAGCFMDANSNMYIFIPIMYPVAQKFGIDPIHFGMICTVNLAIGQFTPPVGTNLFVASSLRIPGHRVGVESVAKACLPMIAAAVLVLLLVTYVPQVTTCLIGG